MMTFAVAGYVGVAVGAVVAAGYLAHLQNQRELTAVWADAARDIGRLRTPTPAAAVGAAPILPAEIRVGA